MADKTFEVLLKTTADRTGAQQTKADLQDLKNEARGDGPGGGLDPVNLQRQRDIQRDLAAADQAAGAQAAERLAQEERRNSILIQRQALIASEVEALALEAAGETEAAAALTAEVELRRAALQIQQSTNLSEEESLVLARQRIAAEEQIAAAQLRQKEASLFAGVNIGRARQEATTLVREIATGTVNMRTLGALAGSLGPALGISAIAALVVGEVISSIGKKLDDNRISSEKESVELQKQVQHWKNMAAAAKDFSDIQKLTEEVSQRVSDINEKIRQTPGEASGGFFETELNGLKLISNFFGTEFDTSTDKAIRKQAELRDVIESTGKVYEASARRQVEAVRAIIDLPYPQAINKAQAAIAQLSAEQENLNRSDRKQEESWQRKQSTIAALSRTIDDLSQHQVLLNQAEDLSTKVGSEKDPARRAALQKDLDDLREKLVITKKIKEATDDAAASGKAFTKEESAAIENEVKGPLEAKLRILRQLLQLGDTTAQPKIDKLLNVRPPTATDSAKVFYERILADANSTVAEVQRAKANLQLILDRQLRELDKPVTSRPPGLLEPGNIDLANRPRVKNDDGSISTVRSISTNIGGKEVLIPTVAADGSRILTNEEALEQYLASGKHLGIFSSVEAANAAAEKIHDQQADLINRSGSLDRSLDALEKRSTPTPQLGGLERGATKGAGNVSEDVTSEAANTEQVIREAITRATESGLQNIRDILPAAHAEALFGPITQAVQESSNSINDGIPPVVTAVDGLNSTLATGLQGIAGAIVSLDGKFAVALQGLQTQINDLYQSQS